MKYLMITANFAPRGASPSIRTVNLVKALVANGHEVHVLTYDEKTLTVYSEADEEINKKIPSNVGITRIKGGWLRQLMVKLNTKRNLDHATKIKHKYKGSLLATLLIPDPHIDACMTFIKHGKKLVESLRPDVIVTHGYPFSMHIVGYQLKKKYNELIWVADYGDPWTGIPISELLRPEWRKKLDYKIEKILLSKVDLISLTTGATEKLYHNLFPSIYGKSCVIPMGFDKDDFKQINPISRNADLKDKYFIVHTGRVYNEARDPYPFIKAIEFLIKENISMTAKIRVIFVGELDIDITNYINNSPSKEVFIIIPWVPVNESIAWMKTADLLLLLGNKGDIQIPGKVYQYIGSQKPILMTL